jgi:polyisoprenyl-phosphate glycosyltransferase
MTRNSNSASETRRHSSEMPRKRVLSFIVPVYCNAQSLPELVKELDWLENELSEQNVELETIFVDDGSEDESYAVLKTLKAKRQRTKIVKLTRNFGAIPATKAGLDFVSGDAMCILAADLQDPLEQVKEMVEVWLSGQKFIVSERRTRLDALSTKFFAALYYALFRFLIMPEYPRRGFNLMIVDKELMPNFQNIGKYMALELFAFWLGYQPVILQYDRRKRQHGRSRWTLRKKINLAIDNFTGFSIIPLRITSAIGLATALLSFLYGLFMISSVLLHGSEFPGFPTIATLMAFLSGLILVSLGMIGEYLWRIYDNINGKPESVIEIVHD